MMSETLFTRIIDRTLPAKILYEDEHCLAFEDIDPQAPFHCLLIPKKPLAQLNQSTPEDKMLLGHLLQIAPHVAAQAGHPDDFRLVINKGAGAGQTVFHLHLHILAGRSFTWPPG